MNNTIEQRQNKEKELLIENLESHLLFKLRVENRYWQSYLLQMEKRR